MALFTKEENNNMFHFNLPSYSNQDRCSNWQKDGVDFYIICDGHGVSGELFADTSVKFISDKLSSTNLSDVDLTSKINIVIEELELHCRETLKSNIGGTTLSLLIIRENDIWTVNLGDSEIVLFDKSKNEYQVISEDHSPNNINEFKRIIESNPDVVFEYDKRKKNNSIIYDLYEKVNDEWFMKTPPRQNVYLKNLEEEYATYFGNGENFKLSTTRCIGDFNFKDNFGASAKPYVAKIPKLSENQSIIIASDGFWDCWKYTCILKHLNSQEIHDFKTNHIIRSDKYFGSSKDDATFFYVY